MKTKLLIICCCLTASLSNCKGKTELQDILTDNCFWDILNKGTIHPVNSCFKFKKDGSCNFYYYNFFDKKRTDSVFLYDNDDVIVPNKWNVVDDSMQIRGNKYYLISYSFDSVFLTATGTDTMVLIKNCTTFNPKEK